MNAHARQLFVDGLLGKVRQSVHICRTIHGASPLGPRYQVLVDGEYYECGRSMLAALRDGFTPAELELEPCDHEPSEIDPFDGDYSSADHFPALYRSGRA